MWALIWVLPTLPPSPMGRSSIIHVICVRLRRNSHKHNRPSHANSAEATGARKRYNVSQNVIARLLTNGKTFNRKLHADWSISIKSSCLKTYRSKTSPKHLLPNRSEER